MSSRRAAKLIAGYLVLCLAAYGGVDLAANALRTFRRVSAVKGLEGAVEPSPFTNPALTLSEADAALPLGSGTSMTLGELVRLLNSKDLSMEVSAFYVEFMSKPALRQAWRRYPIDKDGVALQRALTQDREFANLFELFSRSEHFQFMVAMARQQGVKNPQPTAPARTLTAQARLPPMAANAEIGPGGGASAAIAMAAPTSSASRTGPGYDGEPQPGEVGAEEAAPSLTLSPSVAAEGGGLTIAATPSVGVSNTDQAATAGERETVLTLPSSNIQSAPSSNSGNSLAPSAPCWPPGHCKGH